MDGNGEIDISLIDWIIEIEAYEEEFSRFQSTQRSHNNPSIVQLREFISEFIFYYGMQKKLKPFSGAIPAKDVEIVALSLSEHGSVPMISISLQHNGKLHVEAEAWDTVDADLNSMPSQELLLQLLLLFYQVPLGEIEEEPATDGLSILSESKEFILHLESLGNDLP